MGDAGGLAVVDKAAGWTSHDVVARLRRVLGERRVGHAGTLDPDATGVLLVGVGRVTRLLRFLTALPKTYTGEVVLGVETSTLDASGTVVARHDMAAVGPDEVRVAAAAMVGPIEQVPPMVSAVKVGGRRLHELAREGVEVERAPRPVVVHRFDVRPTGDPLVHRIEVECSSGTYVRVLAADLGAALGGGAHLRGLRRVAVGSFGAADMVPLDRVSREILLPPSAALRDYPSVTVSGAEVVAAIGHGKVFDAAVLGLDGTGPGPWAVLDGAGDLLAVYEPYGARRVKPAVVVASGQSNS
jgi:tRNA pseudouridine55 synthase